MHLNTRSTAPRDARKPSINVIETMKTLCVALLFFCITAANAIGPIYRCGNIYTNTVPEDQKSSCKLVEGGNLATVPAFRAELPKGFEACLEAAAKNPTVTGVNLAADICRRRFGLQR